MEIDEEFVNRSLVFSVDESRHRPMRSTSVGGRQEPSMAIGPESQLVVSSTLADEVFGRSLDEMWPQTRNLLVRSMRSSILDLGKPIFHNWRFGLSATIFAKRSAGSTSKSAAT